MSLRAVFVAPAAIALALGSIFAAFDAAAHTRRQSATPALSNSDETFLAAREAADAGNLERFAQLAPRLAGYPLASYVEFWGLQLRLRNDDRADDRAPVDADVRGFLARNAGTYIADRLRLEWLLALGKRQDIGNFERELPQLRLGSDPQLRCLAALARYQRNQGRRIEELAREAREVLATTREAGGEGCWALTETLLADERVDPWERMRSLVENNLPATAKRLISWLPGVDSGQVALAIDRPAKWLASNERTLSARRDLAMIAIARLARQDPTSAARFAEQLEPSLTVAQRGAVWGRIGHMAAYKHMPEALGWYARGGDQVGVAPEVARRDEVLEWQVRAALRGNADGPDWTTVREAIERMPEDTRDESTWTYWYARAIATEQRTSEAAVYLRSLARRLDFYGRLAAEEMEIPVALPPRADPPTTEETAAWEGNAGFTRALKFYELGLRPEGNREWAWQLRGKSDRELLAAAEYARSINVYDRMIAASERTRTQFDFSQRFPAPHRAELARHAQATGLEETWLYALIRQESRFIQDARSTVGAQGLMQIMPATARYVARRVGMSDYHPSRIAELDTNLRLGTTYLRLVYDDLDGQPVLASAAYNAGPRRARNWRASLPRAVEGAIFVETIPFDETREYVKKVMANSVIYAALFEQPNVSLKALLGAIAPKSEGTTELP